MLQQLLQDVIRLLFSTIFRQRKSLPLHIYLRRKLQCQLTKYSKKQLETVGGHTEARETVEKEEGDGLGRRSKAEL